MTDLTTTTALDADLYELDTMIAEADSVDAWASAEALAVTLETEWREHAEALLDALAEHRRIDPRYRACAETLRLRVQLATSVQYAEARALEASDRVEVCRHHRELKERSPMERAYQNFLAEEATQ